MKIGIVTLFPEIIHPAVFSSILGRAQRSQIVEFKIINPRDFAYDRHHKVDDSPYGGEPGMLIKPEPVALAIESFPLTSSTKIIFVEPHGIRFDQSHAEFLAQCEELLIVCGHYEGLDARLEEYFEPMVFSVGDFILTGGEIPALLIADSIVRRLPSALGNEESLNSDSFSEQNRGLLSAPNYTRPEVWRGISVPTEITNGNHKEITRFREKMALDRTALIRPDLLNDSIEKP